jgi:hypothetical protein
MIENFRAQVGRRVVGGLPALMARILVGVIIVATATLGGGCGADSEGDRSSALVPSTAPVTNTVTTEALTATSSTDEGYIDPAKCFGDAGARTVSSKRQLAFARPRNVEVEAAGTTPTGKHPISFKSIHGEPFRIYAVATHLKTAGLAEVLDHPERIPYVGYLAPPASGAAIKAGVDCLEGYRGR